MINIKQTRNEMNQNALKVIYDNNKDVINSIPSWLLHPEVSLCIQYHVILIFINHCYTALITIVSFLINDDPSESIEVSSLL